MPSVVIHAARAEVLCSPLLSTQHKAINRATADDAAPERAKPRVNQAARGLERVRKSRREGGGEERASRGAGFTPGASLQRERNNEQAAWPERAWGVRWARKRITREFSAQKARSA